MWKAFREWKPALEHMFASVLTPEIKAKARQSNIQYGDDREAFEKLTGHSIDSIVTTGKINEFRRVYSHVRVYHACRPENVSSYYEKGLMLRDKSVQVERFRSIFLSGEFPELTEEMLQQSIKILVEYSDDDGELYLAIDDRFIIKFCGHYLIYGSEYLAALVIQLPIENAKKDQYLFALREIGKPTFLEINLPNTSEYIRDNVIREIIQEMLTGWACCLANSRTQPHRLDCGVSLNKPLLPQYICSHYHPRKIPDNHMGYKIYDAETGEYAKIP